MRLAFLFDNHILQHEPLGAMYIASYVRSVGHDCAYFCVDEPDFERKVRAYSPQVLAYSIATGQQRKMMEANTHLRESMPGIKFSLWGGPHPTFFHDFLAEKYVDGICIGEGELPTGELLTALEKGDDHTTIENLHFKLPNGELLRNKARNFKPDLDNLPFPDHDIKDVFPHLKAKQVGFFIAGRGCPFHCTFCFNDAMMTLQGGRYVRFRDPAKVCEEIEHVRSKYDIKLVSFQDDIFGIDVKWLERFGPVYRERIKIPFMCHYRADLASERAMKAMYEAGCVRLIVGLESGDADLRERVMDKRVTTEELLNSAERAHRYNIELLTQNMFGIPGETVETALSTVEINIRIKPEVFIHYFFMPYPMTKLGDIAQQMGVFDGDFNALPESYHTGLSMNIPDKRQVEKIGHLSYFFIDMPVFYWMTKYFLKAVKPEPVRMAWFKLMRAFDKASKKLGLRKKSCWYHEPRLDWPFPDHDGSAPPPPPSKRGAKDSVSSGHGVAPNLARAEGM